MNRDHKVRSYVVVYYCINKCLLGTLATTCFNLVEHGRQLSLVTPLRHYFHSNNHLVAAGRAELEVVCRAESAVTARRSGRQVLSYSTLRASLGRVRSTYGAGTALRRAYCRSTVWVKFGLFHGQTLMQIAQP